MIAADPFDPRLVGLQPVQPLLSERAASKRVLIGHPSHYGIRRSVDGMENRAEVREFLISRRAKITPQQAGLPDIGRRRVPGLRRGEAGSDPHDKDLHDLVGELSTRSGDFHRRWSAHNVRYHGAGTKHFHHREVGELELAYEAWT